MKLISLNTWGGKFFEELIESVNIHSADTDIFCFQEMSDTKSDVKMCKSFRANLLSETKGVLLNFQAFYFPVVSGFDFDANPATYDLTFGQAIFVKNSIKVTSKNNYFISKDKDFQKLKKDFSNLPTPLQCISFSLGNQPFSVFNFHGTSYPGDKLDTDKRLSEAKKVKGIMESKNGAKILVGDFNLLPETESIKIFNEGMRNLIKEFNIQRTRSKLSPYFGEPDFQKHADYIFVSNDIKVMDFQVPKIEISDHLPMILEFS